ncbi:hypothetical protein E2O03_000545 [Candidatus Magnetomonas plexicatena]|nr:hypothetical protein E2O03_000545 [Nitrospirales bacterium LBB_01]
MMKPIEMLSDAVSYRPHEDTADLQSSEQITFYENKSKKPFTVYHDDTEHSIKLLKGDSIEKRSN